MPALFSLAPLASARMDSMPRRCYIQTVGCQMNVLDSELVAADLLRAGYELVDSMGQADTILLNTCSVRQHAEDKIYSALGRLKHVKQQHPQKIIGVLGCMAQKDQEQIFRRAPHVDLVVGPGQLGQLPALLGAGGGRRRAADGGEPRPQRRAPGIPSSRASPDFCPAGGIGKGDSPHLPKGTSPVPFSAPARRWSG